ARFAREARIAGGLESDHIVRVYDAGVDEATDTPFIVMELLQGEDLGGLVRRRGSLPPAEAVLYLFQAALALDKAHTGGFVHRDLKPENLFLTMRDDGSPCLKVLDFGIAKVLSPEEGMTLTQNMVGTPAYMAPEQIRAEKTIGPAADIHALAQVAYALLVGETYWREEAETAGSSYMLAISVLGGVVERPVARALRRISRLLPAPFDAWFLKATAPRPDARFERASVAIAELGAALGVAIPGAPRSDLRVGPAAFEEPARGAEPPLHSEEISQPRLRGATMKQERVGPPSAQPNASTMAREERAPPPPAPPSSPSASSRPSSPTPVRADLLTPTSQRSRVPQRRFQVRADESNGIVHLKVWGFWDVDEARAYLDEFRAQASRVSQGPWYVLADISEFAAQKPEVSVFVEKTMEFAREHQMRRAANLVSSALSRMQIARLSMDMGLPEYSFFQSEADAVTWLLRG
ncbi:MAG TPA: serine/threonine-protein kinase, partial [Candidatus Nanopelagicales bacterium]|nr:serine/threonine-protein kinase [Candidatus Nanopelagicales bacterium]